MRDLQNIRKKVQAGGYTNDPAVYFDTHEAFNRLKGNYHIIFHIRLFIPHMSFFKKQKPTDSHTSFTVPLGYVFVRCNTFGVSLELKNGEPTFKLTNPSNVAALNQPYSLTPVLTISSTSAKIPILTQLFV